MSQQPVTSRQFSAARNIAVAALRRQQEIADIGLPSLMPDHFEPEDRIGDAEIDIAVEILNAIDPDQFPRMDTDPDVGTYGWLNDAIASWKTDDSF